MTHSNMATISSHSNRSLYEQKNLSIVKTEMKMCSRFFTHIAHMILMNFDRSWQFLTWQSFRSARLRSVRPGQGTTNEFHSRLFRNRFLCHSHCNCCGCHSCHLLCLAHLQPLFLQASVLGERRRIQEQLLKRQKNLLTTILHQKSLPTIPCQTQKITSKL